ncbi:MAG: substrate-binding domain-containing protein [Burkholderiales bacterium]|jgi:molybdate transport system substrate-binding protein|nr:substrate-binding domain-containing protein [Burkholderiales bacterium]
MNVPLRIVSSMATREVLAELVAAYAMRSPPAASLVSVGGVDAAKRVRAGEAFDAVVLASDAIDALTGEGHLAAGSRVDLVRSGVAVAVRSGSRRPDIRTEDALRQAVLSSASVAVSTGPSGVHLTKLFARWGMAEGKGPKLVQAPPGVPVAALVARGEADLGFQQLSELLHAAGIDVLGPLPESVAIVTTFSGALAAVSVRHDETRALIAFLASPEGDEAKRRHGMEPA